MEPTIRCNYDEMVDPSTLKPHPKNRNAHPKDQVKRLGQVLEYQGFRYPIKVSKASGYVTSGHGRIEAAKLMGWDKVPVNYQEYESTEQEYADLIADNSIAAWSELDMAGINADIGDLGPDFDIDLLGIEDFTLDAADKHGDSDPDETPEAPVEACSARGELYLLGEHRLLCGDAVDSNDVDRLMAGERADMVFTDPPYGMNLDPNYDSMFAQGKSKARNHGNRDKVLGDDVDFDPSDLLLRFNYVDEIFLWGADYYAERIPNKNDGAWLTWDKTGGHDSLENIYGSHFELCWMKKRHKRYVAHITWKGMCGHDKKRDGDTKVHPTQKPVKLAEWFFDKWGKDKTNIVDLYGGSGSTLIAAEKTNRKCYMMELEPKYISVILDRWEQFTGNQAKREDGVSWQEIKQAKAGNDQSEVTK